jgi:hypothetical protein
MLAINVPVERVFSGGTDLITQKRCSLSAKTIHACICRTPENTYIGHKGSV